MAVTQVNYTGNGSTTNYSFTFPYLDKTDVKVRIDGTIQDTTAYSFANATTIAMASAPASGAKVVILRDTNVDSKKATFYAGSAIKSEDLNDNYDQVLYTVQEIDNNAMTTDGTTPMTGDLALGEDLSIVFEGATDNAYETTLTVADPTADRTITLPNETGTVITSAGTDVIDSAHYVAGSIDLEHMSANSVDSDQYVDGSINGVHISNDAIDSQHYAAGSIDLEHMSANSVDSDQYVDGSIDLVHMSANSVDSDQYVDGSIDRVHLSADIIDGTKIADDAIASEHIADNAINNSAMLSGAIVGTGQIINDAIVSSKIADDVIDSEHYAAGSIDTEHIGDNQVTIDKIDDGVIVLNSEQAGHTVNDTSFFTTSASDTRYFRQTSAETILDGATWTSSDAYIATTAAIDDRIVDLVDDVGGFVPIDNETSFPNANPDVNNGAGTLVSIKALASAFTSNGSGVATIANGTVGNSTVTINGLDNSTTYAAGFGMIVETTTTLNTYKFHRTTPKATEVTTVAGSIANVNTVATNIATVNDFADKYRIASSAPGSNNDDGDLYYNTSDNKLYVYDGSAWGVAASLNGSGGTITGNITFNDNVKGQFGTGNDLQIYHDGSNSYIHDAGTGQLRISSNNFKVYNQAQSETIINAVEDGAVSLYYDNNLAFQTDTNGVRVYGTEGNDASIYIFPDEADDTADQWRIRGFASSQMLRIESRNSGGTYEANISCNGDGAVELYYDSAEKFKTTSSGTQYPTAGIQVSHVGDSGTHWTYGTTDGSDSPSGSGTRMQYHYYSGSAWDKVAYITENGYGVPDGKKLQAGNNDDLQIYHDGTNNYIKGATASQHVIIEANSSEIQLRPVSGEYALKAVANGAVELYYDNSKKFETFSWGIQNYGNVAFRDSDKATFGAGEDLQIYHNGSHSIINNNTGSLLVNADNITFQSGDAGETIARFLDEGTCELWFDNVKKLSTYSSGITVYGSEGGNGTIQFYADEGDDNADLWLAQATTGGEFKIQNYASGSWEKNIVCHGNGAVELYFDDGKKFETKSDGVKLSQGHFYADDNSQIKLGDASDLELFHDGTWSYVRANNGNLAIQGKTNENSVVCIPDGKTSLYYDNSEKLETTSDGIKLPDSAKLNLGASGDFQLFHDGTNNEIMSANGAVHFYTGANIEFRKGNSSSNEAILKAIPDGSVELYYDDVKKFHTTTSGAQLTGHLFMDDDHIIKLGSSQDLQIYHTGNYGLIEDASSAGLVVRNTNANVFIQSNEDIRIGKNGMSESYIECKNDDAVELYYDNSKKLETLSSGVLVTGNCLLYDNHAAKFGTSQDLVIYHDGSHSYIEEGGTGDLIIDSSHIVFKDGGTQVLETVNTGIRLDDDKKIYLGTGSDLSVYHSGNHAFNINSTGTYYIHSDAYQFNCADNAENLITANEGGSVSLYYDGSMKFRTMSGACEITGHCQPSADANGTNIGQSSLRWTNIFASNAPINTSDRNEKNTIQDCDLGLSFIDKLKPVSYKWNNKEAGTKTNYGLIAQDLLEVIEEEGKSLDDFGPIHKEEGSAYGLNYTQLISPLIKAVQELSARVAELEAK